MHKSQRIRATATCGILSHMTRTLDSGHAKTGVDKPGRIQQIAPSDEPENVGVAHASTCLPKLRLFQDQGRHLQPHRLPDAKYGLLHRLRKPLAKRPRSVRRGAQLVFAWPQVISNVAAKYKTRSQTRQ